MARELKQLRSKRLEWLTVWPRRSHDAEPAVTAWLKTAGDVDVFLEAGGSRKYFVFELAISGDLGKIVIGNGYESLLMGRKSRYYTGFRDLVGVRFPRWRNGSCFTELYREAKRALAGKDPKTSTAGESLPPRRTARSTNW